MKGESKKEYCDRKTTIIRGTIQEETIDRDLQKIHVASGKKLQ